MFELAGIHQMILSVQLKMTFEKWYKYLRGVECEYKKLDFNLVKFV